MYGMHSNLIPSGSCTHADVMMNCNDYNRDQNKDSFE